MRTVHILDKKDFMECSMAKVVIDAGHGGEEPGAMYEGRKEKDDTLRLALAVGNILENSGVDVAYTRTEDVYNTPLEKARIANREGGDFLISIHRNSSPEPNQYSGVETLVYDRSGKKLELAEAINEELSEVGFRNLGVKERPGLIILRRSQLPAVLVEAGFLNTEADNMLFDEQFDRVARAIADGVLRTLYMGETETAESRRNMEETDMSDGGRYMGETEINENREDMGKAATWADAWSSREDRGTVYEDMERRAAVRSGNAGENMIQEIPEGRAQQYHCPDSSPQTYYRVQTGAFRNRQYAEDLLYRLLQQNFPAYILREDDYYKVQVGAFRQLDNAVRMEQVLRKNGYSTFLTV